MTRLLLCSALSTALCLCAGPVAAQAGFTDVTAARGITIVNQYGPVLPNDTDMLPTESQQIDIVQRNQGNGAAVGDYDNDGDLDVLILSQKNFRMALYRNNHPTPSFTDVTVQAGLSYTALEKLNLADRAHQLAGTLSGGWKQRLALAAAIMHKPKLLLLDEPTAGVDPKARREFWDEIHALAAEGLTVLVSTHYMDEAERCHKICYLAYGKLLARGTVDEVIDQSGTRKMKAAPTLEDVFVHLMRDVTDNFALKKAG